jgi:MFS family permease
MTSEATAAARIGLPRLWTGAFSLLCITVFLGYVQMALLSPTIPLFVSDKGGSALLAGLALLSFSLPSFLIRPLFGRLSDTWSAAGVLALGLLLLAIGGALHLTSILAMVFVASIVRGLGWAGLNTGGYTVLAMVAPLSRRGEASGYYTGAQACTTILFPAVALWMIDANGLGFTSVFLFAALAAAAGVPLCHFVLRPMTQHEQQSVPPAAASNGGGSFLGMLDTSVILPATLNLSSTLAFPAVSAFLPLYAKHIGIGNVGLFYIVAGASSLLIRPILGRRSDSMGRGLVIALAMVSQAIGIVLIIVADNLAILVLAGIFTSIGAAVNGSVTTALAIDMGDPAQRGRAMATFSISFQLGNGVGAIIAGALADYTGYHGMYVGALAMIVAGFILLVANWATLTRQNPAPAARPA